MYKLLLCLRYLRTRWIALASIVSVTLGVATMIVVNSVMAGFTREMQDRIKGILSDISFESKSLTGMRDPADHMRRIEAAAGQYIDSMTAAVHVPAMLSFDVNGESINRPVQLIGGDPKTMGRVGSFNDYLQHPEHRRGDFNFQLREGGYDTRDHLGGEDAVLRRGMDIAGWELRRRKARWVRSLQAIDQADRKGPAGVPHHSKAPPAPAEQKKAKLETKLPPGLPAETRQKLAAALDETWNSGGRTPGQVQVNEDGTIEIHERPAPAVDADDPVLQALNARAASQIFDPEKQQHVGCVLGIALASYRPKHVVGEEHFLLLPGDDVQLTMPTAGTPPKAASETFTIVDFYESKMSEYDGAFVFVPIEKLQDLRGMIEPATGQRFVTSIQIKLKHEADGELVRDLLRGAFSEQFYNIQTWRDKQGPLLAAVQMETLILNVLLFLIIAVAGFGILAIFFMIVVEKTKDIGILKSLGASSGGIAGIFLSYGLSLGIVGAGAGLVIGLAFVRHINQIADLLGRVTGHEVFDPDIYYFYKIPTKVDPFTVGWIVLGALAIAVCASVLPACRAARFRPVEALRYE
jgi:lipoprotein-releasing system permease protein